MWCVLIGFALGLVFMASVFSIYHKYARKEETVGTLVIDHQSIPEDEPYLFLQLHSSPRTLIGKKKVMLDVSMEKFVTQK